MDLGQDLDFRLVAAIGHAQIGAEIEQVVLNALQLGIDAWMAAGEVHPRHADGGVGLVDGAAGGNARRLLGHALAAAQRGGAVIAGARVDLVQDNHDRARRPDC